MKRKCIAVSGIMIAALLTQSLRTFSVSADAREMPETKQYVIMAEDDNSYLETVEKITDNITAQTPVLSDNNVMMLGSKDKFTDWLRQFVNVPFDPNTIKFF